MEENSLKCIWDGRTDCPIRELFLLSPLPENEQQDVFTEFMGINLDLGGTLNSISGVLGELLEATYLHFYCAICPVHRKRLKD